MKKFKKPEFKIEKIDDCSEPVFMACSGIDLFRLDISGYQHQHYDTGRADARFQLNAHYDGPTFHNRTMYMYLKFDQKVDMTVTGWKWEVYADEPGSYIVVCKATPDVVNHNESIGLGDFIVTMEDLGITGSTLLDGWITFDGAGYNCK